MKRIIRCVFSFLSVSLQKSAIALSSIIFLLNVNSCCLLFSESQDLVADGHNYPDQVENGRRFFLEFYVENPNNWTCDDYVARYVSVNFKMIKRSNGYQQVFNTASIDTLRYNTRQTVKFDVLIEGAGVNGIYDVTFTVDPDRSQEDANRDNNVDTGTIEVTD